MDSKKRFMITTPIYYPSDKLHIGHAYTTVAADAMARFKRLTGFEVFFLTGTDEHGQKIERKAAEAGGNPREYVDRIVTGIRELWKTLDISNDDFIRTTEERHRRTVQEVFRRLYEQGDIYKGTYEGWYCTPCEAFWTERQLVEGNCPDCARKVERVQEESYFFRMSKYQGALERYLQDHPDFIQPPSRLHEMVNNFLKPGLEDLCVSRTTFKWGIPVPFDPRHVIYVWIDALANYITATGFPDDPARLADWWPADVHLVGKEIVRFHTITWPILLMALGLPLPGKVFGHGWLILEGGKMSKSKGNVIDPILLSQRYGVDAVRYYLLREIPFGADGVFTEEALWQRTNKDLANDFGNLLSRVLAMVERYFGGEIPAPESPGEDDRLLQETASSVVREFEELMDRLQFSSALTAVWRLVAHANRYVDQSAPWDLAKREDQRGRLGTVLYTLSEALRFISVMVGPFMPGTPPKMWAQMGIHGNSELQSWESLRTWGLLPPGTRVRRGDPIFPRLEWEDRTVEGGATAGVAAEGGARPAVNTSSGAPAASGVGHGAPGAGASGRELLSIDEFARLELKTALVLEASPVEGASKLLSVQLDAGGEERRVVAGIAGSYRPEDLVGKTVVLVANLKPAKIRGVVSEGMILAVGDENSISLLTVDRPSPPGGRVR